MYQMNEKIPVELAVGAIRRWKVTYKWIPIFGAFASVVMAFSAGANNLPAPFSTPIGSGSLRLVKASIMAILIYVPGAAFASNSTLDALFSDFLKEKQPNEGFLMWSMVVVLITAAIWLALATYLELPVSSQQSTQGALLGTILVTEGFGYMPMWEKNGNHDFNGGGLLWIFLEWTVAPLVACFSACFLFNLLKAFLLRSENAKRRILAFLPMDYGISAGLLCLFVIFQVLGNFMSVNRWAAMVAVAVATMIGALLSLVVVVPLAIKQFNAVPDYKSDKREVSVNSQCIENQDAASIAIEEEKKDVDVDVDVEEMLRDFKQMRVLETVYEEDERSSASPDAIEDSLHSQSVTQCTIVIGQSTPFKQLLQSTPNRLVQARNFQRIEKATLMRSASTYIKQFAKSTIWPVIEYDRKTLIRHALAEKYDEVEDLFSFPHLLASCIFALIQSASEAAALVSPYGAILDVFKHRAKYSGNGEVVECIHVSWWFRGIGGLVAAMGFCLCGWRLTRCLGGKLTYMSNSRGLVSQLSSAAAILVVNGMNLPVSSTHVFVGSLVGVGMADDIRNLNWRLLLKFLCGWILTVVACCGFAYVIFSASIHSPAYVVP